MFSKRLISRGSQGFIRSIHTVPTLPNQAKWASEGINGLYSAKGFQTAWLDYQNYLTLNLTLKTVGTENESRSPYYILLNSIQKTYLSHQYHYASQAFNNHFFFQQLTDAGENKSSPSAFLMDKIKTQYGDLDTFKNELLASADSMIGQGWVFLVEDVDKSLKIVNCGNDGTPFFYGRNQSLDLNGPIDEFSYDYLLDITNKINRGDKDWSLPILAINVWDYAYLPDYGVSGRADYLENLWKSINWDVVNKRLFTNF